jgi:hypothetical protein
MVVSVAGSRMIELNKIYTVSDLVHLPSSKSTQYLPEIEILMEVSVSPVDQRKFVPGYWIKLSRKLVSLQITIVSSGKGWLGRLQMD